MVGGSEDHQAAFEIKISRENFLGLQGVFLFTMKFHHTIKTEADGIAGFCGTLRDEFFGDADLGAPTWAFVSGDGAELTII